MRAAGAAGLAAASGLGLLAAAPPAGVPLLAGVALVPLLWAVRRAPGGAAGAAALGWLTGAVFYAALAPWLVPTVGRLQRVGPAASVAAFGLFVAYHALQFALAAVAARWSMRAGAPATASAPPRPPPACAVAAAIAAAWVLLEWGFPKLFPWSLGATLGPHRLLRQGAELAGVHGLAAVVVMINALLAYGGGRARAAAVALLAAAIGYGALRAPAASGAALHAPATLRVGVLQAGAVGASQDARLASEAAWHYYAPRSRALAARADVLVWPEGVLRADLAAPGGYGTAAARLSAEVRRPLLLGALARAAGDREHNAVYAFAPALVAVRHKQTLVPFGEYAPGAAWLPPLRRWRTTGAFAPGRGAAPVRLAGTALAVAVCGEAIRAGAFNAQVRAGAGWLLNPTDDGWFASPRAAAQHLEMTRLRAVETRRWLVRASHSGASAVFDPTGAVVAALPFGAAGELAARVVPRAALTPYVRWGDAPLLLACAAALAARRRWK